MGRLPDDVLEFIEARFAPWDHDELTSILNEYPPMAPRILRSVLFLADGRIGLLRHYLDQAQTDVRKLILAAEYVSGIAAEPLPMRDMAEPFSSDRNLGEICRKPRRKRGPAARSAAGRRERKRHHEALVNRRFQLGRIRYVIMSDQPSAKHVRCYRIENSLATMVRLPLEFVLEQLAEHIELESLRFAG